tara:strand:- start:181 stop:573 length:393 start_codon:yes stop_codon:yes gene_type:complete
MCVIKKIFKQSISIVVLCIYLLGSLSIFSSHNHIDDDHQHHQHHHHDITICEKLNSPSLNVFDCSHESHIVDSKENCAICDHFSNCKPTILDNIINTVSESFTVNEIQLVTSHYLIDATNTQNKSPPFII